MKLKIVFSGIFLSGLVMLGCSMAPTKDRAPQSSTSGNGSIGSGGISPQQKQIDDQCFVQYSQEAGRCNSRYENNDAAFDQCLKPIKVGLVQCCKENNGSAACDQDAQPTAQQKQVDDACFVQYSQEAGRCNSQYENNDAAFDRCLRPVKRALKQCCAQNKGSATCDQDAQ